MKLSALKMLMPLLLSVLLISCKAQMPEPSHYKVQQVFSQNAQSNYLLTEKKTKSS